MLREFSCLEKEGKDRVTKSLILLWRFIPITQYGRKGMKEYYIVAFMAHLRYLICANAPQATTNFNPPLSTF